LRTDAAKANPVRIDGQTILAHGSDFRGIRTIRLAKAAERSSRWNELSPRKQLPLAKRPSLQGPIDDAFTESFLFVHPTGKPIHPEVAAWVQDSFQRATNEWRSQFRGLARVKDDIDVTSADIAEQNLILWGDPGSNKILRRIINGLPLRWTASKIRIAGKDYDSSRVIPIVIYPNPLNRDRYVVLNSGFTFADRGGASNAQQTPKLPDWAVLDVSGTNVTSPVAVYCGHPVLNAGFFDESWQVANIPL
jgi:hypothetical protein